ncbi:putative FMN-dependent luciferase-like monooxygenase [Arthrobacter ginkgonis]|uniref:FMN-dependent luciferase-like monooxygenase n=2 Tax=Arthrobacter ginkgonis TaxID=1630594 RepID=A0ABP7D7M0_9MICC
MSHVSGDLPTEDVYRATVSLAQAVENAGFEEFWIAQHHFSPNAGHVSSPFVFLAHLGAVVTKLTLGVGVVALPFEDPIRLAEDIVTTEKLLGPRLRIGVGPGNPASRFDLFGITGEQRHAVFEEKYAELAALLDPAAASDLADGQLWPAPDPVRSRTLYQATYTPERGRVIGERGLGLLLSITHPSAGRGEGPATAGEGQRNIVDAYLEGLPAGVPPRITATRAVHVTDSPRERDEVAAHALALLGKVMGFTEPGALLEALGVRHAVEATEILGYSIGTAEHVRDRLEDDPAVAAATGVIFQNVTKDQTAWLDGVAALADVVVPALAV